MKPTIYFLIIIIFSCKDFKKQTIAGTKETDPVKVTNKQVPDSLLFITNCDTIPLDLLKISRKRKSLLTFQKQTHTYCSPSTDSQIIDTIPFNTEIVSWKPIIRIYKPEKLLRDGKMVTINKAEEKWYEIKTNGKTSYLPDNSLTLETLRDNVLFGSYIANKKQNNSYQILSFNDKEKHKIVDSMELNRNHGYEIESLFYNGLDLCKGVIRYRDFRQSSPGTSSTTFIALDNQGQLKKIISSYSGEQSNSTIYFPLKFKSGKILLVANGNTREIFDYNSGELNTYKYPENLNVPIEQLIVETKVEYSENIELLSEEEIEISKSKTILYQWNGNKLTKLKTTDNNGYK